MNKVILVGNLTRDPENTQTGGGISLTRFSIAVNRMYTNASGEKETDFFNIVTWRSLAENCIKYLAKGRKVCVVGMLQNTSYDDKEGIKRYRTDVIAEDVEFLSASQKADNGAPEPTPPPSKKTAQDLTAVNDERLPF